MFPDCFGTSLPLWTQPKLCVMLTITYRFFTFPASCTMMILTERDCAIVQWVYAMDGCATQHLRQRFFPASARTTVYGRLARLVQARYLTRISLPSLSGQGSGQGWYVCGPASLALLRQTFGLTAVERKQLRHATLPTNWLHEIATRSVRCHVQQAIESLDLLTLDDWTSERELRRQTLRVQDALTRELFELTPDGRFDLVLADGRTHRFFLEIDRGSQVSGQRFIPRLRAHLQHADVQAVLFVVPTEARAAQLCRWSSQAARQLNTDPGRIWIALLSQLTAETVLERPIWSVVGQGKTALLSALLPPPGDHPIYQSPSTHDDVTLQ